ADPFDPSAAAAELPAGVEVRRIDGGRPALAVASEVLALVQAALARDGEATDGHAPDGETPNREVTDRERLAIVTSAAVWTGTDDPEVDPAAATAWGLLRSTMSEHPDRFLLVDTDDSAASDRALPAALTIALATHEDQLALRGGRPLAPRLLRLAASAANEPDREHGTVLITGATGALGGLIAERLITRHGVRHLLLVSRRGPDTPGADALLGRLHELGAEARLVACDTADRDALAEVIAAVPAEHPLTGVIHAAGVLDDGTVETLTPARLTTTLTPKADAATNLHTLTRHHPLTTFILFSSITATTGTAGQANYAAANAYLDALAHHRHTHHLPATSLAWGLWHTPTDSSNDASTDTRTDTDADADSSTSTSTSTSTSSSNDATPAGMAGTLGAADLGRLARAGIAPLPTEAALRLFDDVFAGGHTGQALLIASRFDTRALAVPGAVVPPPLRSLVRTAPRRGTNARGSAAATTLAARLAGSSATEAGQVLLDLVRETVAVVLGHTGTAAVAQDRAFTDLGFDSLAAVDLRNRLGAATGLRLPTTVVFDHPTPNALAELLRDELLGAAVDEPAAAAPPTRAGAAGGPDDDPIVIVAMACRFPGQVRSPEQLWNLLADGVDAISDFPADRGWDLDALYDPDPDHLGTSYSRQGG
ncbi:type I polyketide synthase, partial [Frankia sp. AiPs1]|uniref:type I polyketide synthase n=1 Tax=Frankia sp. AiPs1 TaxID=573493 RepID=UPI002043DF75